MYSGYLAASEFILQKINSGVWFVQTFLRKMLYIAKPPNFSYTSLAVNMWIMNQFHTHSQKKQNPAKKFIKSGQIKIAWWRWDRATRCDRRDLVWSARCCNRQPARCDRRTGARSVVVGLELGVRRRSLFFLSLCDLSSLSLSLSLSLSAEMLWSENRNWE